MVGVLVGVFVGVFVGVKVGVLVGVGVGVHGATATSSTYHPGKLLKRSSCANRIMVTDE